MAAGGTCPRRHGSICRRRGGSKLAGRNGGHNDLAVKARRSQWIYVRGHRIRLQGRMRVDANGDVYVPDSEDEEPGMEVEAGGVADLRGSNAAAAGMKMVDVGVLPDAISVGANTIPRDVDAAAKSIPANAVMVEAEGGNADGVKAVADTSTGDEMHPTVVARLKKVLSHIDPALHDIYVSMLKVMVPAFFIP